MQLIRVHYDCMCILHVADNVYVPTCMCVGARKHTPSVPSKSAAIKM